jgi:outer membrane protein assembly factor BamB
VERRGRQGDRLLVRRRGDDRGRAPDRHGGGRSGGGRGAGPPPRAENGEQGLAARQLWRSNRLRNANGPTIYRDGHLYGFAGAILVCVDAETQEIKWRERTGAGTLMTVGSQLVVLGDGTGEMLIADVSPERFTLRHRLSVLPDGIRAVTGASFADGRFYVRNLREVVALRVQ